MVYGMAYSSSNAARKCAWYAARFRASAINTAKSPNRNRSGASRCSRSSSRISRQISPAITSASRRMPGQPRNTRLCVGLVKRGAGGGTEDLSLKLTERRGLRTVHEIADNPCPLQTPEHLRELLPRTLPRADGVELVAGTVGNPGGGREHVDMDVRHPRSSSSSSRSPVQTYENPNRWTSSGGWYPSESLSTPNSSTGSTH